MANTPRMQEQFEHLLEEALERRSTLTDPWKLKLPITRHDGIMAVLQLSMDSEATFPKQQAKRQMR